MDEDEVIEKKEETTVSESDKPTIEKSETTTIEAPEAEKPSDVVAESDEAPDKEDISDMLNLLNEVDKNAGGKGAFADIPAEYRGVLKQMFSYMVMVDKLVNDPAYKAAIEDCYDQQADGKTPSFEVAVARTMDLQKLQDISENENFDEIQSAVKEGNESREQAASDEAALVESYESSVAAGKAYAESAGYDEAESQKLFQFVFDWFKILGDGNITEKEWANADKMRNYDPDMEDLKAQIPEDGTKEVLPDNASVEASMSKKEPAAYKPQNTMEAMASQQGYGVDVTDIGKRKRK